ILGKVSGGGGGVGEPFQRDPAAVRDDIIDEVMTIPYARDVYGVVVDPDSHEIDLEATARLRAGATAGR
ncbi:MAG: hypothetical protein ACRDGQ_06115, partial [Candidatus Limnocylindrales bacterium]